jgi:citrate lyase subunit beta/citryl-CoA lyase
MSLFRSWMFVPGNHQRRLEKAKELQADVIIYDLEDAVPLQEKEKARDMVTHALRNNRGKVQFVRVNDPSTPYFLDDVCAVAGPDLAGIVLPKAASKEHVSLADCLLAKRENQHGLQTGATEVVPLIESALGLYHAFEIASANSRVKRLAFGSVDYTLDIGAQLTKEGTEILFARSQLVVVSRAAGIEAPIDAVYIHLDDSEGLAVDAKLARQLGFQGKLVIHPHQIEVVNDVFSPTEEEIEEAKRIAAAFDEAVASGFAAVQVGGKMVDYPVAERAKRILGQGKAKNA